MNIELGSTITIDGREYVVDSFEPDTYGSFTISGRVKERWWFDMHTKKAFKSDHPAQIDWCEVTPEYAEYLRNKPEGEWELRKPEQGDVVYSRKKAGEYDYTGLHIDHTQNHIYDRGYRWCKIEKKAGWRVYDVIEREGEYWILCADGGISSLASAAGCVGFGRVQYKGQSSDEWYPIGCTMGLNGCVHNYGSRESDTPAVPIRARFWEVVK
jgi:hypothetical protein